MNINRSDVCFGMFIPATKKPKDPNTKTKPQAPGTSDQAKRKATAAKAKAAKIKEGLTEGTKRKLQPQKSDASVASSTSGGRKSGIFGAMSKKAAHTKNK